MRAMSHSKRERRFSAPGDSRGVALIEMTLTIPILAIFLYGTIVYGSVLRARELSLFIGREVANQANRECNKELREFNPLAPVLDGNGRNQVARCVEEKVLEKLPESLVAKFGSRFEISTFRYQSGAIMQVSRSQSGCSLKRGCRGAMSKFSQSYVQSKHASDLSIVQSMIFVELWVDHPEIARAAFDFFRLSIPPLYTVSVT